MTSRRKLKRNVNYIAEELLNGCLVSSLFCSDKAKEEVEGVIKEVLDMRDEFVARISHTEPGNVKGFYKKFRTDFNAKVAEIMEALEKLNDNQISNEESNL